MSLSASLCGLPLPPRGTSAGRDSGSRAKGHKPLPGGSRLSRVQGPYFLPASKAVTGILVAFSSVVWLGKFYQSMLHCRHQHSERTIGRPSQAERRGSLGEERPPRPPLRRCLALRRPDARVPDVAHCACSLGPGLHHAPPATRRPPPGCPLASAASRAPLTPFLLVLFSPAARSCRRRLCSSRACPSLRLLRGAGRREPRRSSALTQSGPLGFALRASLPRRQPRAGCGVRLSSASPLFGVKRRWAWAWLAKSPDIRDSDLFPRPPANPSAPPTQLFLLWIRTLDTVDRSVT